MPTHSRARAQADLKVSPQVSPQVQKSLQKSLHVRPQVFPQVRPAALGHASCPSPPTWKLGCVGLGRSRPSRDSTHLVPASKGAASGAASSRLRAGRHFHWETWSWRGCGETVVVPANSWNHFSRGIAQCPVESAWRTVWRESSCRTGFIQGAPCPGAP